MKQEAKRESLQFLVSGLLVIGLAVVLTLSFLFMKNNEAHKLVLALVALVAGVGGVWALFLATDNFVSRFPGKLRDRLLPFVFVGPAIAVLCVFIVYPTIRTVLVSFTDYTRGSGGPSGFSLHNYVALFRDPKILIAFRNNILWLVTVPTVCVSFGLVIAVLVDRIRWERLAKSLVFLPMAISFVGASVVWRFIYFKAFYGQQIGLLNAVAVALGNEPVGWLRLEPWNNFALIAIMVWLQTGFATVILSSAVKSTPSSLLEAARIDGASEFRVFFQVIIPCVRGTVITVTTTLVILVLKVFDIIFVMTSGQFNTDVLANMMYDQMFKAGDFGRGAALAVILLLAVMPVMIRNIRRMRSSK